MVQTVTPIDTHIRTYRSLLKSAGVVKIQNLIDSHILMRSLLHEQADQNTVDVPAFIYALIRLPLIMPSVKKIMLGQSYSVFQNHGMGAIGKWKAVVAPGRRRKMHYDGKDTLGVYIASVTDVDDVITLLTAYQIEWNKIHKAVKHAKDGEAALVELLGETDAARIRTVAGAQYPYLLQALTHPVNFQVKLLSGSYVEYTKATQHWWNHVDTSLKHLKLSKRPIYFVSSNTHSLANVLTRFVTQEEGELLSYLKKTDNQVLLQLWEKIEQGTYPANRENFLYYVAKKYAAANPAFLKRKAALEKARGISTIKPFHYLDITVQVIELKKLAGIALDERLGVSTQHLANSDALIVNVDYPLGWAAYQVLTEIGQNVDSVRGMYIMGKAATQNGAIGDILIPNTVLDQHTKNMYSIQNAFSAKDFAPIFQTGVVLEEQKSVAVKGTFFENQELLEEWNSRGYTIIEMEAGPYLNAIYEFVYYNRYVESEFVNLTATPFELGIVNYASDTPNSKAANLGARNLSYDGVEATYSISLAIVKKIIEQEKTYTKASV